MNQHRANVRNFLVGLNMQEMQEFRDGAIENGNAAGAGYADEYIREVESEFAA
jgi:hypothetical protein